MRKDREPVEGVPKRLCRGRNTDLFGHKGSVVAVRLFAEIGEDFQYLFPIEGRGAYVTPAFHDLVQAVIGRVMVGAHKVRDVSLREDGIEELGLEAVFQYGDFLEFFHIGIMTQKEHRFQGIVEFHFFAVRDVMPGHDSAFDLSIFQ